MQSDRIDAAIESTRTAYIETACESYLTTPTWSPQGGMGKMLLIGGVGSAFFFVAAFAYDTRWILGAGVCLILFALGFEKKAFTAGSISERASFEKALLRECLVVDYGFEAATGNPKASIGLTLSARNELSRLGRVAITIAGTKYPEPSGGDLPDPGGEQCVPGLSSDEAKIDQLYKAALEANTPDSLIEFVDFCARFRRFAAFNARLIQIQRRGATVVGSTAEWSTVSRTVDPDAIPILVLKRFGPIEWVYDVEDTSPSIDRREIGDPFAAHSSLSDSEISLALDRLIAKCASHKRFRIEIVGARLGFSYAGSAVGQGRLQMPLPPEAVTTAHMNVEGEHVDRIVIADAGKRTARTIPLYRVRFNDRMTPAERLVTISHELGHIFCGHLGPLEAGLHGQAGWRDRRHLGNHEAEMEAEAVAWLIGKRAQIIGGGSAAYLRHHVEQGDRTNVDVEAVCSAVGRIESLAELRYGA